MRLLTKINLNYLMLLSVMLIVLSVVGYLIIKLNFRNETGENLLQTAELIHKQIKQTEKIINLPPSIEVTESRKNTIQKPTFKIIYLQNITEENDEEPYLELSETINISGKYYNIKIRQLMVESEDMISAISYPLLIMLLSALTFSFFINYRFNRTVWKDFEKNLQAIEKFSFTGWEQLSLKKTNIQEFDRLNTVVLNLTEKLSGDYKSLKQFTENASHELQTPLAIISLNLEELLQQQISKQHLTKVYSAYQSVIKLDKLNKSLLLLAKIENKQFINNKQLNLTNLFKQKAEEFKVLADSKSIKIIQEINTDFEFPMNPELAIILINNLLLNAIRHNTEKGEIKIVSTVDELKICNTGIKNKLDDKTIFNRFVKHNSTSFGLGLAIVKEICNLFGLKITYLFKNKRHCFVLKQ